MLFNDIPKQSLVEVTFTGTGGHDAETFDDADIRDMELLRARRALAYLKDHMLTVTEDADDGVAFVADVADMSEALPASAGRAFVGVVTASSAR